MNNASLLQDRTYLHELDAFEELSRRRGGVSSAVKALVDATGHGGDPFQGLDQAISATRPEVASAVEGTFRTNRNRSPG